MVTVDNKGITFNEGNFVVRVELDCSEALKQLKELETHLLSALNRFDKSLKFRNL